MLKYLSLTFVLILLIVGLANKRPLAAQSTFPVVPNSDIDTPFCFMQTEDGQILQLESLCRQDAKVLTPTNVESDRFFLENYKRLAMANPDVSDILLNVAETSPESVTNVAKLFCEGLEVGISHQELRAAQDMGADINSDPRLQKAHKLSLDIADSLAPQYYCPNTAK